MLTYAWIITGQQGTVIYVTLETTRLLEVVEALFSDSYEEVKSRIADCKGYDVITIKKDIGAGVINNYYITHEILH